MTAGVATRLRPVTGDEQALVDLWAATPSSPFDDFTGPVPPGLEHVERLPPASGGGQLVVTGSDDSAIGTVSWRAMLWGPAHTSVALEIGISLRPEARGRGHGTRAQRLLADYLFSTTAVHRLQASTDVENVAEQHALQRAGFRREGVLRHAQWRRGAYHDLVLFGRLRTDD